jgi:2,4-dienoyl-CoA reductase-like NADH-dependent reductase (Old Yellow Enzyme family)
MASNLGTVAPVTGANALYSSLDSTASGPVRTAADEPVRLAHGSPWANRYALAPMTNKQSYPDGTLSEMEYEWLVARGRGGFGVVKTCAAYVADTGRTWTGQLGIASDEHMPGLTRLALGLQATGTMSLVQLHHGGLRADSGLAGTILAPFDDPESGATAMSGAQVQQMVADFVAAAVRAERAGFDGVEVHGAHGFLLAQFLDRRNQRADGYGGGLEHRMRFLVEVLAGIRAATGDRFQLGVRLSPEAKGTPLEEGREIAGQILTGGVADFVDMSLRDVYATPHYAGADSLLIEDFSTLPRGRTVLSVTGRVRSAEDAAWCLAKGADVVAIGTGAILHHDFAERALAEPGFKARSLPVSRDVLRSELVGPPFQDYLAQDWDDLVAG